MNQIEKYKDKIVKDIKNIFKENLISVFIFGSYARGDYVIKKSDINILIVRKRRDNNELINILSMLKKWKRKLNISTPLILTEKEIKSSTDVFPMEYTDIKDFHILIYGKDIFKNLNISNKNLRLELENQIKSKLILLRRLFIENNKSKNRLKSILIQSLPSIIVILRNILKLNRKKVTTDNNNLIEEVGRITKIRVEIIKSLIDLKNDKEKNSKDVIELYKKLIEVMEKLSDYVDKFKVRGKK